MNNGVLLLILLVIGGAMLANQNALGFCVIGLFPLAAVFNRQRQAARAQAEQTELLREIAEK